MIQPIRNYGTFYPFPNKTWFLCGCSTSLLKTLWEKEKLPVSSNFSFFHNVFYPLGELYAIFIEFEIVVCKLFEFGRVYNLSFGKGLKSRIRLRMFFITVGYLDHIRRSLHPSVFNFFFFQTKNFQKQLQI